MQSAILYNTYSVLLQLSSVFVIGMFLVNSVFAKPLYLEDLGDKLGTLERNFRLQHLSLNETSQSRGKRHVVEGIPNLCPGTYEVSAKPASGCVKNWLYCRIDNINLTEPQCDSQSFVCLPSITRFGFPKCKPAYQWMQITLRNAQKKLLKLTSNCTCA